MRTFYVQYFCTPTPQQQNVFEALDDCPSGKLNWVLCVGVCTDSAGQLTGFTTSVREVAPEMLP